MLITQAAETMVAFEQIINKNKNTDGSFQFGWGSPIHEDLALYFQSRPEIRDFRHEAHEYILKYDKARRPKRRAAQKTLFDPEALVVLDENVGRIRMAEVQRQHAISAREVRRRAHERESRDFLFDDRYWEERIDCFMSEIQTLEELERERFGWGSEDPDPGSGLQPLLYDEDEIEELVPR
jgi:hypothetical protein